MLTKRARNLVLVSLAGVAGVSLAAAGHMASAHAGDGAIPPPPGAADAGQAARRAARRTPVVEAVEKAAPAVVSIGTTQLIPQRFYTWDGAIREQNRELKGLGSGVIIHPSGLVVTNAHVINRADQVVVRMTGLDKDAPEIRATIVAADLTHDLALLRLEQPGPYPAVTFGRGDDLMPGESVIAIGSPFGLGSTVSTGVVSALNRTINVQDRAFEGIIQTDAAVNQGNSGGALLNILGEWIGVNSAIYSLSGGADGISFSIPAETVTRFLNHAVESGRAYGKWLGMDLDDDPKCCVSVAQVYPVGPAADAHVPVGARVLEIDGRRPRAGLGDATMLIIDAVPKGRVELLLELQDGTRRHVTVPFEAPPTGRLAWERLGVRATEITSQVREQTGFPVGSGILVTEVRDGGPAARVGLQVGDLLVGLGEQTLSVEQDLLGFVQTTPRNDVTKVTLVRPERTARGVRAERYTAKLTVE